MPVSVLGEFLAQLTELLRIFQHENRHRFIAASLLLLYEGQTLEKTSSFHPTMSSDVAEVKLWKPRVHLIDFGHVSVLSTGSNGIEELGGAVNTHVIGSVSDLRDQGFIHGLCTVVGVVQRKIQVLTLGNSRVIDVINNSNTNVIH